jgi:hypothetical protein
VRMETHSKVRDSIYGQVHLTSSLPSMNAPTWLKINWKGKVVTKRLGYEPRK